MKAFIDFFREDKLIAIVVLFWSLIFSLIMYLFSLIVTIDLKSKIFMIFILYVIFSKFLKSLGEKKLYTKVFWITLYFTIAPIMSFFTIVMQLYSEGNVMVDNEVILSILYFFGMILPYIVFGSTFIISKYRKIIINNIRVIRLSLSITIAIITIIFTTTPLILDTDHRNIMYFITLLPFSMNVLLICAIEYYQIKVQIENDYTF